MVRNYFTFDGKTLYSNRQKWQYYTMSDKNNSVKLPVVKMEKLHK